MQDGFRVQRVERELQSLISEYFQKKLPLPAVTSVSRVESTKELRTAKVYLNVMGDEEQKSEALELINDQLYHLQGFLNRNLRMKFVPRVTFVLDDGLDHMIKIQGILTEDTQSEDE